MLIVGCILAVLVGVTLGMLGSGGTILTVPILVYVMSVHPVIATTYSLFAIGVTSFVGGLRGLIRKEVDLSKVLTFGLPSLIVVFFTRSYILPLVPDVIYIGDYAIEQRTALMLLFSLVMIASSLSMIFSLKKQDLPIIEPRHVPVSLIVAQGGLVGLVTGLVGAGGGFLIIPALVNFYQLPMRRAVATSLIIITINSCFGLIGDSEKFASFDWNLLLSYTGSTLMGIFIGFYLAERVSNKFLKIAFGYLILIIGIYIILKETSLS